MTESIVSIGKKTWYKWSLYINIVLFFLVALFVYMVIRDAYLAGTALNNGANNSGELFALARDVAILGVIIALLFFQFFKNLMVIMRRSL